MLPPDQKVAIIKYNVGCRSPRLGEEVNIVQQTAYSQVHVYFTFNTSKKYRIMPAGKNFRRRNEESSDEEESDEVTSEVRLIICPLH